MTDNIIGLATILGQSSVSVIRVSGDRSIEIVNAIFSGDLLSKQSHTITYGFIKDKEELIDEVLVSIFRAPKTYTRENIAEINCHGGIAATRKVIKLLLDQGARMAEPGEFTKRAFLNGRIKLNEAEAVMDLIRAESDTASSLAVKSIKGNLTNKINQIKKRLIDVISILEVNVDYPEYEISQTLQISRSLSSATHELEKLADHEKDSAQIMRGVKIAILGQPNVGKSSLLNSVLEEEKAIVTDIAGTTRDLVEGNLYLDGIKINLIDTAGLRDSKDVVESIGIEKSLALLEQADLILYVIDNQKGFDDYDLNFIEAINQKLIVVINKVDLNNKSHSLDQETVYTSIKNNIGVEELKQKIKQHLNFQNLDSSKHELYLNERQGHLIKESLEIIKTLSAELDSKTIDLILFDLREAVEKLNEITGDNFYEDLIDNIFNNFCLGK